MQEPLNSFADRLIRNNEVGIFIRGLIQKGISPETIKAAAEQVNSRQSDTD